MNTNFSLKNTTLMEWVFFLSIFLLLVFGLLVFYSLSVSESGIGGLWKQIILVLLSIGVFWWVMRIDYRVYRNIGWWLYALILLLLILVFFFGRTEFGAQRWIDLVIFRFQPVEVVKVLYLMFMADFMSKRGDTVVWRDVIVSFLLTSLPVVLIMLQPDLGSSLVLLVIWGLMVFLSPFLRIYFWSIVAVVLLALPFSWFLLQDYQQNRILTFIDPTRDPYGMGYNVLQSQIAIGSGSWYGLGLGKGWQSQLQFLPVAYSDFAFAVLGEEFGFMGAIVVLLCYSYLVWYIWKLAFMTIDQFGYYLAGGIGAMIVFQVFVNIGMNIGVMPVTGIPLPLISSGGTSMITIMMVLAIVLSIKYRGVKI